MGQTSAVLRSLGTKYGLYDPSDHKKAFNIDVIVDLWTEMFDACVPILFMMPDKTEEEKQEVFRKTMQTKHIPAFAFMESQIRSLGGNFIAGGSQFTIADCCMVAAIANLFDNPQFSEGFKQILQNYPRLQEYLRRLKRAFKRRLSDRHESLEKPKLEYFGPFGRADPIRFCLYKAGIKFDDVTLSQ